MLHNNESNIKYTDDQSRTLEAYKTQLLNLQTEITISQKFIETLKKESVAAMQEKQSHVETLSDLTPQVANLKHQLASLTDAVNQRQHEFTLTIEDIAGAKADHVVREQNLQGRERSLKERETVHSLKVADQTQVEVRLSQEKLLVEKAKDAFRKAAESIVWK